jgi:hypothetical protein
MHIGKDIRHMGKGLIEKGIIDEKTIYSCSNMVRTRFAIGPRE